MRVEGNSYVRIGGGIAVAQALGYSISVSEVRVIPAADGEPTMYTATATLSDHSATPPVAVATADGYLGLDERSWAHRPAYARRSMCQSRAIAKLCRINFGALYVMLGASSDTPAEEMDGISPVPASAPASTPTPARIGAALEAAHLARVAADPSRAAHPSIPAPSVQAPIGAEVITATIIGVEKKSGVGKTGKPYVLFNIEWLDQRGNRMRGNTFSESVADDARKAAATGATVGIYAAKNIYGWSVHEVIPDATASDAPPAVEGGGDDGIPF
jgi:hypothetical protein